SRIQNSLSAKGDVGPLLSGFPGRVTWRLLSPGGRGPCRRSRNIAIELHESVSLLSPILFTTEKLVQALESPEHYLESANSSNEPLRPMHPVQRSAPR